MDFCNFKLCIIFSILRQGLGKRIFSITLIQNEKSSWPINSQHCIKGDTISLGLILNNEFSIEILDKGPEANTAEAEEFKMFWGNKSELRRFQDG